MAKLNQIIAVEKGIKAQAYSEVSELHKIIQKPELFNGFSKTYQKKDEDGEELPAEKKRVQFFVPDVLRSIERSMSGLIDITARKDWSNCEASADVVVDDITIVTDAPVSFLLFLEKQLVDLRTFVSKLPVLDEADNWTKDVNSGFYKADETKTHRTKKVQKPIVLYNATPEHPAQTQMITEDVIAGFWTQVKQSGAMPKPEREAIAERVEKLLRAVKAAREAANGADEAEYSPVGGAVFTYLFGE